MTPPPAAAAACRCRRRLLQVTGFERRIVQMQHEIKRKEKEYERLQEK